MKITPNWITELKENEIFVFGSNTEGKHRSGAAKDAIEKFGAIYGVCTGHQGQCYAIVTKDLRIGLRSVSLFVIEANIDRFLRYAKAHPELEFLTTKIGCELAGYSIEEIANCFKDKEIPENVALPIEFWRIINANKVEETASSGSSS